MRDRARGGTVLGPAALGRLARFTGGLGPGLVSGISNDDPSAIGTFSQTGAHFGYAQLWLAF